MTKQHTPGPWIANETIDSKRWGVWSIPGYYYILDSSAPGINAEANAKLIAAAPELLEACKNLLANPTYESRIEAVKAIAKAEGK